MTNYTTNRNEPTFSLFNKYIIKNLKCTSLITNKYEFKY